VKGGKKYVSDSHPHVWYHSRSTPLRSSIFREDGVFRAFLVKRSKNFALAEGLPIITRPPSSSTSFKASLDSFYKQATIKTRTAIPEASALLSCRSVMAYIYRSIRWMRCTSATTLSSSFPNNLSIMTNIFPISVITRTISEWA